MSVTGNDRDEIFAELQRVRAALLAILDAVDYTSGACRLNEMVGAVLPEQLIVTARKVLTT